MEAVSMKINYSYNIFFFLILLILWASRTNTMLLFNDDYAIFDNIEEAAAVAPFEDVKKIIEIEKENNHLESFVSKNEYFEGLSEATGNGRTKIVRYLLEVAKGAEKCQKVSEKLGKVPKSATRCRNVPKTCWKKESLDS